MKKNLLNLANKLQRKADWHSQQGHQIRQRVFWYSAYALLELKWRLS